MLGKSRTVERPKERGCERQSIAEKREMGSAIKQTVGENI
jgi:hypothetical protein